MLAIEGKVNTAVCYATVIEDEAIEQIRRMCDHDFTAGSKIRIMPDVHAGKGCTIGTTMTITDKAVPNVVGVDHGCGMYTVQAGANRFGLRQNRRGRALHPQRPRRLGGPDRALRPDRTAVLPRPEADEAPGAQSRTLGGGNHFIEIDAAADGTKYLVIHSGSRNLGKQVAELYQKLAVV